jgi:hypothetical protein
LLECGTEINVTDERCSNCRREQSYFGALAQDEKELCSGIGVLPAQKDFTDNQKKRTKQKSPGYLRNFLQKPGLCARNYLKWFIFFGAEYGIRRHYVVLIQNTPDGSLDCSRQAGEILLLRHYWP